MSTMIVRCALVLILGSVPGALGALRQAPEAVTGATNTVGNGFTGTTETVAGNLPRVPEPPLPALAPPVSVPVVGSSAPHTADPVVCGVLGGIIVLNWILACCCAGFGAAGGAAAGAEEAEGNTGAAEAAGAEAGVCGACFACVECLASICSIVALVYCAFTGLFRAWLGGQAVSGWCLAMAIISTLQLLACVCICCCASCGAAILGDAAYHKYVNQHSKHVFGSHMHELVHKHKPGGTHPITEGHLPLHDHIHNHIPLAKAAGPPKKGKDQPAYGSTETAPAAAPAAAPETAPAAQAEPAAAPAPAASA
jgi:hypothetical protein